MMTARVTRIFLKRNNKRGIRPVFYFAYSLPCYCEAVRSTLKTLAYDCGNPVQYVCGHSPAVLFYLLRLWQSSAICLRAFARSAFLFTGSPRFARDDNGDKVRFLGLSDHPHMERWALFALFTLHSNKKRGGAPFFIPYCRRILNT